MHFAMNEKSNMISLWINQKYGGMVKLEVWQDRVTRLFERASQQVSDLHRFKVCYLSGGQRFFEDIRLKFWIHISGIFFVGKYVS